MGLALRESRRDIYRSVAKVSAVLGSITWSRAAKSRGRGVVSWRGGRCWRECWSNHQGSNRRGRARLWEKAHLPGGCGIGCIPSKKSIMGIGRSVEGCWLAPELLRSREAPDGLRLRGQSGTHMVSLTSGGQSHLDDKHRRKSNCGLPRHITESQARVTGAEWCRKLSSFYHLPVRLPFTVRQKPRGHAKLFQ